MAVRAEAVTKRYGRRVAVDAVSLAARPGETLGLLGPNGAGKTTLLHLLVGVLRPDAGHVEVDAGSGGVGFCPQGTALWDDLTAEEHLRLLGRLRGMRGAQLARRVRELLGRTGLEDRGRERVSRYSGGMRRRLSIACALVDDPAVLVLDEPTSGIDPQAREHLLRLLASLRERGRTVVLATHSLESAERLCDRVAVLDRGRLLALDAPGALMARTGGARSLEDAFLGLTGRRLRD